MTLLYYLIEHLLPTLTCRWMINFADVKLLYNHYLYQTILLLLSAKRYDFYCYEGSNEAFDCRPDNPSNFNQLMEEYITLLTGTLSTFDCFYCFFALHKFKNMKFMLCIC